MSNRRKPTAVRRQIWEAHGGVCWLCEKPVTFVAMTLDHVMPKSRGGPFVAANLRPAHRLCNQRRGNDLPPAVDLSTDERIALQAWDDLWAAGGTDGKS